MRLSLAALVSCSVLVVVGCSSAPVPNPNGGDSGTGSDGSPQQGNDSGTSQNDSSLGAPAAVSVSIQASCPAITPCGGDPTGTWDYASGCGEVNLDQVTQACPSATVSNLKATVAGRVTFGAGEVSRSYDLEYSATVTLPVACVQGVACSTIQSTIAPSFDTASCASDGGGGCKCDVTGHDLGDGATTYSVQGNVIVTADGNSYDFCVQAGTMSYRHTSGSSPEAGSFQLTKR